MQPEDLGVYKVIVEVTYLDPRGRSQFFSGAFFLHVEP